MKKRMVIMLIGLALLFGLVFGFKWIKEAMVSKYIVASASPLVTVSTTKVVYKDWTPQINSVGSLRATLGVNVTTEQAGMVKTIYFKPGSDVLKDTLLVQLNIDTDLAQLHSLQANMQLAQTTYDRDKAQYNVQAVSKQALENDLANLKSSEAQVAQQEGVIAKKTISAPFSGRLGISNVDPGQFVNPGDKIVSLQTLDPIYIDFYVPQQSLAQLKIGQVVSVNADPFPGKIFKGTVTTIDPAIDTTTRNVEVEATLTNPKHELTPGLFAYADIVTGKPKRFLTLPQTAVSFNPYGEIVFIVKQAKDKNGQPILTVEQSFVTTGEKRGDQITILRGVKQGDTVVSSGQLKLKNGTPISINNKAQTENNPAPQPIDE